jgi:hypothetical protein
LWRSRLLALLVYLVRLDWRREGRARPLTARRTRAHVGVAQQLGERVQLVLVLVEHPAMPVLMSTFRQWMHGVCVM